MAYKPDVNLMENQVQSVMKKISNNLTTLLKISITAARFLQRPQRSIGLELNMKCNFFFTKKETRPTESKKTSERG